jgi:hypothetical protein
MKKVLIAIALLFLKNSAATAQPDPKNFPVNTELRINEIQGLKIGWWKTIKKTTAAATTLYGRTYSATQISNAQKFMEWMQASYTPTGCLGDVKYYLNRGQDKYRRYGKLDAYYDEALPQLYGAYTKVYMFLKKEANGNFKPAGDFAEFWHIGVNQLEYISQAVNCISSPTEHFFIMPHYIQGHKGSFEQFADRVSFLNFNNHSNLQPYQHFFIPPKIIGDNPWYVVLLTKDNKPLPFESITIGELIERLEKNMELLYTNYYEGRTPQVDAWQSAVKNMALIKTAYKTKWNNTAMLKENTQLSFIDILNATTGDLYLINQQDNYTSFPVLRLKNGTYDACKKDTPQWIAVRWNAGMTEYNFIVHLMSSILNNFNFKYVYDYFFGHDKLITPYQPLRSPSGNL